MTYLIKGSGQSDGTDAPSPQQLIVINENWVVAVGNTFEQRVGGR